MNIDLPPQYSPQSVESAIYKKWLDSKTFHAVPDARADKYSMVIPPPNVTGALHLGHAINGTIQDILARYHRMKGDNTLWMPGIDHAGIATQAVVEKTIFEKEHKTRHDLGREELVKRIWQWKEQFGARILTQLQSIGASCDWDRTRFTLDETCAKAVREAFFKMFKNGLIFRGKRLVNWDTHLQTAVADDEIYHEPVKGQLTSIKYPVDGSPGEFLVVATTRPETMLGDTAVAVHPDDPRYKHLIGQHVILPLIGRRIPIIADGQLVDPKFGTGVVKVTPAHDPNDYATGLRHNLEQINLLTPDGKVNDNGQGEFLGKKYAYIGLKFATAARKAVLADLESLNLIADKKKHDHEVGHSDRSKTPIEPYLSDQWFVRMGDITNDNQSRNRQGATSEPRPSGSDSSSANTSRSLPDGRGSDGVTLADGTRVPGLAQAAIDAVASGRVKITPERYAKGYIDWLSQKRDWCISRQLWWGHRIPVWTYQMSDATVKVLAEKGHAGIDEKDLIAQEAFAGWLLLKPDQVAVPSWLSPQRITIQGKHAAGFPWPEDGRLMICIKDNPALEKEAEALGFVQDPDVLDTWFSSALWPLSTMGWPDRGTSATANDELLPYFYPTSLLSTAREILTLWVARMVVFGLYCHGDVPFKDVYIHAVIQDGEGRPMKKSLGNGVDPVDIVASHGADALRFTLAAMATETQDIRMPVVKDSKTGINTSPKFDLGRNFANKIWNASRFILGAIAENTPQLETRNLKLETLEDRWILSRLNSAIQSAESAINAYRFADLAESLRSFFWTDLCDWYLEISKARIKAGDQTVQQILLHCLKTSLQLLHPVMPFITEELWSKLPIENRKSKIENLLITSPWPPFDSAQLDSAAESQLSLIQSLTSAIREIQNRYPAAKGKPVILQPRNAATQSLIEQSRAIIESLAQVTIQENSPTAEKPVNAATAVLSDGGGVQVFIADVIDKTAEAAKLTKRKAELEKLILSAHNKLSNESFASKAPAHIIQGLKDQMSKHQEELIAIEKNLAELQAKT
ncbi:MAG: valine--tRNA ligase [Phycisphaerales bacterium]|nr:valine--tRNA ligase [Phycisphaerales bacterium]